MASAAFAIDIVLIVLSSKTVVSCLGGVEIDRAFVRTAFGDDLDVLLESALVISTMGSASRIRFYRLVPLVIFAWVVIALRIALRSRRGFWPVYILGTLCVGQLVAAWRQEHAHRTSWRTIGGLAEQKAELERQNDITMRLLSSCCDCVLSLDEQLCLLEPSVHLSALLKGGPLRKGANMREFHRRGVWANQMPSACIPCCRNDPCIEVLALVVPHTPVWHHMGYA